MAQDYVGSNNMPLLQSIGQFGTRASGGKDFASARCVNMEICCVLYVVYWGMFDGYNLLFYCCHVPLLLVHFEALISFHHSL